MAFNGTLLKVGDYTFPLKYIRPESFQTTPSQRQDLDSYRDANGDLIRNALPHYKTKIEFETPYLHYADKKKLMSGLKSNYTNEAERKVSVTYFDDEFDSYKTGTFYISDIRWTYYNVDVAKKDIIYTPTRIVFIEY